VEILLACMLRLDRTAPRISSTRKLLPFQAWPNGTSNILAVARRPPLLGGPWPDGVSARPGWVGGKGPEPSHKSLAEHPPPQVKEWGRSSSYSGMRMFMTSLLVLCLLPGCELIMVGDPAKKQDLSTENDAEENLKAIRKMLDDQAGRSSAPAEKSSLSTQPLPSEVGPAPTEPVVAPRPHPSPSSSTGMHDASAKLPWTPSPPERAMVPDRPVPAYTSPAPVGPDYSGSIRCAPDGMGGQRCLGR
jgi:hypothetical protein